MDPRGVTQRAGELAQWALGDQAATLNILRTFSSLVSGPVVALLIASRFSPALQGYYYTFGSVLALQVFLELGLITVIIQFASHEWSLLRLDDRGEIVGDPRNRARLVSLGRLAFKWYGVAACLAILGLGAAGVIFFSRSDQAGVDWLLPWLSLSVVTGTVLFLAPAWALLIGCGQVSRVYGFQLVQGLVNALTMCTAILLGAGLWTTVAASSVGMVLATGFMARRYWPFFRAFLSASSGAPISWRAEIWPMQWRIALSWLSGYFTFSLFTPVMFQSQGAVAAGQWGMTWGLANALSSVSTAWVSAKSPGFGALIARGEYRALDRTFWRVTIVACVVAAAGGVAIWGGVLVLNALDQPLSARLLAPLPTGLLMLGTVLMQISYPQSAYLRAHKKEPFLWLSIGSGMLIGSSALVLGPRFGALGLASAYLTVIALFSIPVGSIIWYRCRRSWHGLESTAAAS